MTLVLIIVGVLILLWSLLGPASCYAFGYAEGKEEGMKGKGWARAYGEYEVPVFVLTIFLGLTFFFGLCSGMIMVNIDQSSSQTVAEDVVTNSTRFSVWQNVGPSIWMTRDSLTGLCYVRTSGGGVLHVVSCEEQ